jgi:hypothetical protein
MNAAVNVEGYGKLTPMVMEAEHFYQKTSTLFGPSETGKSTILDNIMAALKPYIPVVYVINPTGAVAKSNLQFRVPKGLIKLDPTVEALSLLLERQDQAMRTYYCVNNVKSLKNLFIKCNDYTSNELSKKIVYKAFAMIKQLQKSNISFTEKTSQIEKVKEIRDKSLIHVYKNILRKYKLSLLSTIGKPDGITKEDKFILKYLDFNPNILLVTDDAASLIKQWCKSPEMQKIFWTGRHYGITCVHCMQDDKTMTPELRKGNFVSIFTDPGCAMSFFNAKANGFTKQVKKDAELIIEELFQGSSIPGNKNYKKIVYNRLDNYSKFQYFIANPNLDYKFGCTALWNLWDNAPKKENVNVLVESNSFYKSFSV